MATTTPTKRPRKSAKPASRRLSNSALLNLAARNPPPQSWYDDQTDPTKPISPHKRGRSA